MIKLTVYPGKSVLESGGQTEEFVEGPQSQAAANRAQEIRRVLGEGFLEDVIVQEKTQPASTDLSEDHQTLIREMVDSVTSEVGRALIGLSILQFCIKAIVPNQSIRLHKGGRGAFSWKEGVSMRTIDKNYITPTLRKHGLLSLNADGFMMTRSLAENYPYTQAYKAAIRGARENWLTLVDLVEAGDLDPGEGLKYIVSLLINRADGFKKMADKCLRAAQRFVKTNDAKTIEGHLLDFAHTSNYGARLFEIVLHSAFQVLQDQNALEGALKPLSQMRSANKKHGNIGDVEVLRSQENPLIIEAWDAKFGKSDLGEELEELSEKLKGHPDAEIAGFVCDKAPEISKALAARIAEVEALHETKIPLLDFSSFVKDYVKPRTSDWETFAKDWLIAFTETLCQKRRAIAPVDEPCNAWVGDLLGSLEEPEE